MLRSGIPPTQRDAHRLPTFHQIHFPQLLQTTGFALAPASSNAVALNQSSSLCVKHLTNRARCRISHHASTISPQVNAVDRLLSLLASLRFHAWTSIGFFALSSHTLLNLQQKRLPAPPKHAPLIRDRLNARARRWSPLRLVGPLILVLNGVLGMHRCRVLRSDSGTVFLGIHYSGRFPG